MTTGGTCTASVVGPATVILAAHCVDHQAPITLVAGGRRVVAFASRHLAGGEATNPKTGRCVCFSFV
jgi:V8-like Glu-specific endopeptidase